LRQSGNDEIMKTIMDVMKPPELPSMKGKENRILSEVSKEINESSKDRYQTKLKERVSTKGNETDKSEYILKSERSVAYNQRKEESKKIKRKYSFTIISSKKISAKRNRGK